MLARSSSSPPGRSAQVRWIVDLQQGATGHEPVASWVTESVLIG